MDYFNKIANSAVSKISALGQILRAKIEELNQTCFQKATKIKAENYFHQNLIAASQNKSNVAATETYCRETATRDITDRGFLKAGTKVDPDVIRDFSKIVIEEFYQQMPYSEPFEGLSDYRKKNLALKLKSRRARDANQLKIAAIDASKLRVPIDMQPDASGNNFAEIESGNYRHALLTGIYDVIRKIPIMTEISYSLNEGEAFLKLLPFFQPGWLFIFDRGYYSYKLAKAIEEAGCYCLFRLKDKIKIGELDGDDVDIRTRKFKRFKCARKLQYDLGTKIVISPVNQKKRKRNQNSKKIIKIRAIKQSESKYIFFTNAPRSILPIAKLPDVYHARWRIEEFYQLLKQSTGGKFYNLKSFKALQRKVYFQQLALLINQYTISATEAENEEKRQNGDCKRTKFKKYDQPISPKLALEYAPMLQRAILYGKEGFLSEIEFVVYRISNYCHNNVRNFRSYDRVTLVNQSRHYGHKPAS